MKRNFRLFRLAVLMILLLIFGAVLPGNVQAAAVKNEKAVKEEKNEKDEKDKEESYSAKVIRLLHYEGEVGIEDASGSSAFMMENIRLSSGQALITGPESSASVGLDDSRIVTLDADTRVEFIQEKDQLELNLVKGTLFLDVQDKLDENEVLDIRTSTMAVGIRGTIVFVSVEEEGPEKQASEQKASLEDGTGTVTMGVLEGTALIRTLDKNGKDLYEMVQSGQKAKVSASGKEAPAARVASSGEKISKMQTLRIPDTPAVTSKLEQTDLPGFVYEQIEKDDDLRQRVEGSGGFLSDIPADQEDPYPADGVWTWESEVILVAQSASKMYDGTPLTRESDVLVYGLPDRFSIETYANGSRTNAGTSENPVAGYEIYNHAGENVTGHFTHIRKVSGLLVVDPTPVTIWTGSAEKVYDGTPLTAGDASVRFLSGYRKGQADWTNRSYLVTEPMGVSYNKQILYGLCGRTMVHASDPYTGEIGEAILRVGERLTICPRKTGSEDEEHAAGETLESPPAAGETLTESSGASDQAGSKSGLFSFEFRIDTIDEKDLPIEILQIYADNPDLLAQACRDAEWDPQVMAELIANLPSAKDRKHVELDGLKLGETEAGQLMTELTNIRLTVDSDITKYYTKPLGTKEAHFTPVRIDDDITVRATGSQTDAGESINTYEIDWGKANPENYIVKEDLGTLTVTPAPLSVTTGSAEKSYDGLPLTQAQAELSGLVNGESASVTGTGSITRVGRIPNPYSIRWGTAKEGNYEIAEANLGTLTVTPAGKTLTITTGSASKTYDGSPLESGEVTVEGLIKGDSVTVTPTGSITNAGSAENTYTIDWGDTNPDNYNIEENLGTLTVRPADLTISTGSAEKTYDGSALKSGGVEISGLRETDSVTVTSTGSITDAGSVKNTYAIGWGDTNPDNYHIEENLGTLTVRPADLTISTGSDEKTYDGSALKSGGVEISGLQGTDSVTVTPTGSITDAGSEENTYAIDWGDTNPDNYHIAEKLGTLTVRPADLTISTGSAEKTYDGEALTSSKVTVNGLAEGETITVTPTGSITDVGTAKNTCTIDWSGAKEDNYTLTKELGTLTVNKAPLTVKTGSAEKDYDGKALTSSEVTITGLAAGETITVTPTGSITQAGTAKNNCTIDWGSAKESNYTLTTEPGTLTVNHAGIELTITTGSDSKTYDGSALTDNEASVTGLVGGDTVTVTAAGSITDAGTAKNTYTIDWGETDSKNYTIVEKLGTLTVNKAPLTIRTGSAEKTYDGTALTSGEVSADGLAAGESVTVTADGSITDAGETDNTYTIDWGSAKESNYTLSEQLGTLKVEPMPVTFDLKAPETLYSTDAWVPGGLTASWPGKDAASAEEENEFYDMYEVACLEAVFALPQGKVTMQIPAVSGEGEHKLSPDLTFTEGKESNYEFSYINNTVKMETVELTIDMNCTDSVYNGGYYIPEGLKARYSDGTVVKAVEELILDDSERAVGVEASFHIKTGTLTLRINGVKDAGTYTVEPYQKALTGVSVSFGYTNNTMVIQPAPLTIKTGSAEKTYDGTALTSSEVEIEGLAAGETITVTPTGSITQAGSVKNSCSITWGTAKKSNYDLTTVLGTLTVNNAAAVLTINTGSAEKTYDGKELTSTVAAVYGLIEGDSVTVTTTGTITDAGTAKNTYTIDWGDTDKDNYTVEANLGTLTVNPKDLTVSTGSAEKTYDGTALTESGVNITGLVEGETVTVTPTGTITDAGSAENACTIDWSGAKEENYTLTRKLGTLTVNKAALTVKTGSASKTYDGTALTSSEVTITGLAAGETITVTPTGTITQAGTEENSCTITWGTAKKSNYDLTTELGTLTVNNAAAKLTITTPSSSKTYDGTPLAGGEATVSGLIGGDSVTVKATGTITDAGTAENTYTIDWGETDSNNYTIVENLGTLTVNKAALTITTGSAEKTYDGTALTSSEANAAGLAAGETVTVTAAGSITDVGETKNAYTIDWDSAKEGNYTLSEELGTLKVTTLPVTFDLKAPETLDSTSAWVPEGLTVSWTGSEPAAAQEENKRNGVDDVPYLEAVFALPGGKVTMTIPSVSGEGEHTLAPELNFTAGKASNYDITYVNNEVKMIKPELTIDMHCTDFITDYDGGYYMPEGILAKYSDGTAVEVEEDLIYEDERAVGTEAILHLKTGTLTLKIRGVKDAGTYTIEPYEAALTGEDVTISYTNNTIIINPAPLTITTGSAEKVYDGEELTNGEVTIDGLADGETITVTPTGSITDQGEAENTYTIGWGSTKKSNYDITEERGSLKVTPLPVTFDFELPERLYFTDSFVPVEVLKASWPDNPETYADSTEIYGEGSSAYAEAVFTLPGGKATMTIPAISGEGDHKVEPTLSFTEGKASNYEVEFANNETKMALPEVTIDMGSRQVEYGSVFAPEMKAILEDGTEVTPDVTDLIDADAREYTFTIDTDEYYSEVTLRFKKVTDAGTHTLVPYAVSQSVTDVKLIYKNNTWTIHPAPLTIRTGSAEKVYDGTALTNSEVTVTGDVLERVDFSTVKITASGSIVDMGEKDNTYTIDWGDEKEGNFDITSELGKLKVTPLPVTIDLNAPETLSTTDPWIPEGVTLSYGGSKYDPEGETVVGSPEEGEYYLKDVFDLPGGKVTVKTPAVSGEGTHTLKPELTFASGNKKSNYDISYTNHTVKMGAAVSPLGFSASSMAKRPAAVSSGMEMLTAGARAITDTLSTEAAAMAGKETDQAGKAAASSAAVGKAASEGKEQAVQNDAAPDQTSEGEGFTDTDVLSADGEEKVQPQDPDPQEDQTAEEDGEEKKTPEPEVPGDRAPAQAEPVEKKEEKPADKEPAPTPAPAEPASAEPAEADSKE